MCVCVGGEGSDGDDALTCWGVPAAKSLAPFLRGQRGDLGSQSRELGSLSPLTSYNYKETGCPVGVAQ